MKHKLLLIGAGGHCKVVVDLLLRSKEYDVVGIVDLKERIGDNISGIQVVGTDSDLPAFYKKGIKYCFISIGSIGDPDLRVKSFNSAQKIGFEFPNLIHPSALISSQATMGCGNYIAPKVVINAGSQIANNCIINTGTIVEHDCKVGNFVNLCPGSLLSGRVHIGDYSHIGTGSIVSHGLIIGTRVIIGVGSVVVKNMPNSVISYGNPCKERKTNG
jgi:sugar O-acyltransferase (sialic acid O-acetyltransferase NeuD family)